MTETENILKRLEAADREHQKEIGKRFLLNSIKFICIFLVGVFIFDAALHLSAAWRFSLLLTLIGGTAGICAWAWYLARVRRNRLEHIARFLEDRHPALGSSLINFLQLRMQADDPKLSEQTRRLAQQAVEHYARDLKNIPIEPLARTENLRRDLKRAALVLAGFLILLAAFFRVSTVEFARFFDPFGDHPPYSFTRLEIVSPGSSGTNVIFGKGITIRVKATGHQPKDLYLTAFEPGHPERSHTVPMFSKGKAGFDQLLEPVRSELIVFAHTKNHVSVSKQIRIGLILTPQMERVHLRIVSPAYTGLKSDEKPFAFKPIQALVGSELKFRLESNRPLRDGTLQFTPAEGEPETIVLKVVSTNEVEGSLIARESGRLRFTVTDVTGLASAAELESALTVTHDLPPEVRIAEPSANAFVAMDFKLKVRVETTDDYGVGTIRLHRALNSVYSAPKVKRIDSVIRDAVDVWEVAVSELGVEPGDVISLFAEAIDSAPEPHMARSQTVELMIISVEDYNNFLREQSDIADAKAKYDELNADLQELIEKQRQITEAADTLKAAVAEANPNRREQLVQRLDALLAQQSELNHRLNQHSRRMDEFVRDNPLYDVEEELKELLQEQARNIRASTRTNAQQAGDIAQRSSPSSGPRRISPDLLDDFKKSSEEQVARLEGVRREAENEIAQTLEDMSVMQELLKDFNQFESLYRTQQELVSQAAAYNRAGALSREDQIALKDLAAVEKRVASLLRELTEKLRDDAEAAEKLFPKAAQSARDLADRMEELRLRPLAERATERMLAAAGDEAYQTAERLRAEMEKLFNECQGGNCPSSGELDNYLTLQKKNPGNNFSQMARSRKFGTASGRGMGMAQGEGQMGSSGYAVIDGAQLKVLGNESSARNSSARARDSAKQGKGQGTTLANARGTAENPDVLKNLNPVDRQSGAVSSEAGIDEYSAVVESYFKSITSKRKQP